MNCSRPYKGRDLLQLGINRQIGGIPTFYRESPPVLIYTALMCGSPKGIFSTNSEDGVVIRYVKHSNHIALKLSLFTTWTEWLPLGTNSTSCPSIAIREGDCKNTAPQKNTAPRSLRIFVDHDRDALFWWRQQNIQISSQIELSI